MPKLSPLASVHPKAQLADDVEVGPFCVIGPEVTLGPGCVLMGSVTLDGHLVAGAGNVFHPYSVIGGPPQDKKYRGAPTRVILGDNNIFRESVTVHRGTEHGQGLTRIGNDNMLMATAHIGHDSMIGNRCIITNNVLLAGHVHLGNYVNLGGAVGVRQFVTIGDYAFVTGMSRITQDVPPFCIVDGPNVIRGTNTVGLSRAGVSPDDVEAIDDACKRLFQYRTKPFAVAMEEFDRMNGLNPHVKHLLEFLRRRDQGRQGRYLDGLARRG